MTTQAVSFTLTRWHKIVERLNASIAEAVEVANKRLIQTSFSVLTKQAYTAQTVADMRQEGLNALHFADTLLADVARIRVAVGEANSTYHITQKLAEIDVVTRQMNLYKSFLNANEGKIDFDAFSVMETQPVNNGRSLYSHDQHIFGITVVNRSDMEEIKAKVAMYKRLVTRLSDEVADANRNKITIMLSNEAMDAASLNE